MTPNSRGSQDEGEDEEGKIELQASPQDDSQLDLEAMSQELKEKERSLKAAKERRKQVERDAQLLANRIALLKQEDIKTWKKIEETQKRTKEVLSLKE